MAATMAGKKVGPIGFGMMGLTARKEPLPDEQAIATLKAALDGGCTLFNGGEFYGPPTNNSLTLFKKYYEKYPEDADKVVLNVKGCVNWQNWQPQTSKDEAIASVTASLEQLGPKGKIDVFEPARKDPAVDYEGETLATLDGLVKEGKIGSIACSEINANTIRSVAKKYKIQSVEMEFSMFALEPLSDGTLEACAENGITVLAYSPIGRGMLGGKIRSKEDLPEGDFRRTWPRFQDDAMAKNNELHDKVAALAAKKGCTAAQIAINWVRSFTSRDGMPTIIPIPGASTPERAAENAKVVDLTDDDLREIDEILKSFVPAGARYPEHSVKFLQQ